MEKAWQLEGAGFRVFLPAWWTRQGTKQRLSVRANIKSPAVQSGGLSLDEIIQFDWRVALGEHTLTLQELQTLAKLKIPLVRIRGQWVQMSVEEIQAAIQFWKQKGSEKMSVRNAACLCGCRSSGAYGV